MDITAGWNAFGWGILSAISLPLGAILGLWLRPGIKLSSSFMAFGAGALLFALSIELFGHVPHYVDSHGMSAFYATLIGAISGSLIFDLMNQYLNNRGAFMRNLSVTKRYISKLRVERTKQMLEELGRIKLFSHCSPDDMAQLIYKIHNVNFHAGETIFNQGEEADGMYFIVSGEVDIILHGHHDTVSRLVVLKEGDTFGELGILSGAPRSAEAVSRGDTRLYKINKSDIDELIHESEAFSHDLAELAASRVDDLSIKAEGIVNKTWTKNTLNVLNKMDFSMDSAVMSSELSAVNVHAGGVGLAIWLGILIDAVPESLVIGMLSISVSGMSLAFIAGVFLANMPEAMSSGLTMKNSGMKTSKIMLMWGSICLLTGVGAFLGAIIFPAEPTGQVFYWVLAIEGLAGGAMLTMIAETMLPEAFEQGGAVIGISTLLGFLAALFVKVV